MKRPALPPIQGRRFDVEMLQDTAFSLTEHASKGPTWLRHRGRISFVVLTGEPFEQIWPDHRRAWSVDDMPIRHEQMLLKALEASLSQDKSFWSSRILCFLGAIAGFIETFDCHVPSKQRGRPIADVRHIRFVLQCSAH